MKIKQCKNCATIMNGGAPHDESYIFQYECPNCSYIEPVKKLEYVVLKELIKRNGNETASVIKKGDIITIVEDKIIGIIESQYHNPTLEKFKYEVTGCFGTDENTNAYIEAENINIHTIKTLFIS